MLFSEPIEFLLVQFDFDHTLELAEVELSSELHHTVLKNRKFFLNTLLKGKELDCDQIVYVLIYVLLFR